MTARGGLVALALFMALVAALVISCDGEHRFAYNVSAQVLNKDQWKGNIRGSAYARRALYIFDGKEAKWYEVNEEFYNQVKVGDTLNNVILRVK